VHSGGSDAWRLDPSDVARHAQLRRRSEQVGPLGKAVRYCVVVLALAGAFAVYWNFDALRQVTVEAPALSALFKSPSPDDASNQASHATGNATVESSAVVGTAAPTSVSTASNREPPVEVAKAEEHPGESSSRAERCGRGERCHCAAPRHRSHGRRAASRATNTGDDRIRAAQVHRLGA
jgi:hypothetical protein